MKGQKVKTQTAQRSQRKANVPLTCISGGPMVFGLTRGKFYVRGVTTVEMGTPLIRALVDEEAIQQMVIAFPEAGLTRDYRKASVEQVCAALKKERKKFRISWATPPPSATASSAVKKRKGGRR